MAGFIDRQRAARLMTSAGCDALVFMQPKTIR